MDAGEISPEFLEADLTDEESLRADDKPALVLDLEHNPPPDNKLMMMEPKPEPQPVVAGVKKPAAKPAPKTKQSLNEFYAEKAYRDRLNRAEEWASHSLFDWSTMEDSELLEVYEGRDK